MQASKPYPSFLSDENLESMKKKTDEPPEETESADRVNNDARMDNVAEHTYQEQADDNDYGDGDADMGYGGDDDQDYQLEIRICIDEQKGSVYEFYQD